MLIVVFLFAEALGLFNKKVIEEGYVLAVNKANPVQELSAAQIKDVFDEEITNWKELGGPDAEVKVFRLEDITSYFSEEELGAMKEMINPDSLNVLTNCYVEKYLADAKPLDYLQFQRIGYFNVDKDSTPENLVFNRTVSLKDTWSKINK